MESLVEVKTSKIIEVNKKNDKLFSVFNTNSEEQYEDFLEKLKRLPAIIDLGKSLVPENQLVVDIGKEQNKLVKEGILKLMKDKDGNFLAILTKNGKVEKQLRLKELKVSADIDSALNNLVTQQQLAKIIDMIASVQRSVDRVIDGQQDDRIALCRSAEQQLITSRRMIDKDIKRSCIINAIQSAENSRNMIMCSLKRDINYIENLKSRYKDIIWGKEKSSEVENKIKSINEGFNILTKISLIQAIMYYELNEKNAMLESIIYYLDYIKENFQWETLLNLESNSGDCFTTDHWINTITDSEKNIREVIEKINNEELLLESNLLLQEEVKHENL